MADETPLTLRTPPMSDDDDVETPLLDGKTGDGDEDAPKDKYLLTFWIMFLFGVGSLLPWNMFITAEQYFRAELSHYDNLSKNFENYLIIAAQVPNVTFLFINAFYKEWLSEKMRILISLLTMLAMMVLTAVLAALDSDEWQVAFFGVTMASVVVMNVASAIFQGGVFGMVGRFPPRYRTAVMSGQGLGGTFAALANIFSLLGAGGAQQLTKAQLERSAIGYFMCAVVVIIISIVGYVALYKLPFAKYYSKSQTSGGAGQKKPNFKLVLKQMWPMALSVALVFFVTLSIFPAITASIKSVRQTDSMCNATSSAVNGTNGTSSNTSTPTDDPISEAAQAWICTYFTPVTCFLLFNAMDFIGRTLPTVVKKPGPRYILVPVCARLLFIPLFLFCKFDTGYKPYFNSDAAPIVLMMFMAVSNGYLGTLSFIYAPSKVAPEDGETAGALMAAFLGSGLLSGTLFSFLSAGVLVDAVQKHLPAA
ncbi:equilibrative nucleoside transporter 2-like [Sycon ciliatum]|uniref:equilibrative nucleoside transporter 2-like n=1 Tax=Sycon ciliatum TaxID=27933 RepID=UPI0020A9DA49|eukprot:scpid22508/ scgid15119/ Equilibrative nucleoside transporter 1; Equilibrative nitrobenzylmercaptopurine riboside-sensitive nucleoside transporter; Nucleoside transporter, es-type; Solute carrier family 29 member 1